MINRKPKILVVEDEKDLRDLLAVRLEASGYEAVIASSGEEGLFLAHSAMPDLILLDIMMPGIDGFEVKARLSKDPSLMSIPVIFLTAKGSVSDKVKGLKAGVDDYIVKPFESAELMARIESVLGRRTFYEEVAMTDGLTGLYNVAYLKKQIKTFFAIAKRYKQLFSLAIIDIDNLKQINDTHGHIVGDQVLKEFAAIARNVFREADIVTRYGGDEFVVLLPSVNMVQAERAMERLKQAVVKDGIVHSGKEPRIYFSVSTGVATYDESMNDENQMISIADARMYEDKHSKLK